ncbi:TPA: hypothetical protein ACVU4T_003256 [Vibrio parahaemolyticus]
MIEKLLEMIMEYVKEEGFMVSGTRFVGQQCYYDVTLTQRHISVYRNGAKQPFYRIETMKDAVSFCQVISSLIHTQQLCALIR